MFIVDKCRKIWQFSRQRTKERLITLRKHGYENNLRSLLKNNLITLLIKFIIYTAQDFTFTTKHIHNRASFLLWLSLFILSGAISPLFSSGILDTYQRWELIFQFRILLPFHTFIGFSRQECHSLHQQTAFFQNSPP